MMLAQIKLPQRNPQTFRDREREANEEVQGRVDALCARIIKEKESKKKK